MVAWDEVKRRANLVKHGIDFLDAEEILDGPTVTTEDRRFEYSERRWVTLGFLAGVVVSMVYTERGDELRIISIRKAQKHEERYFLSQIPD